MPETPSEPRSPIPVTILSGFLGAGKTTLLKRILEAPEGVRFGVLVNDFGAINIDAALIAETGADQVSLANGCICCTIRDDLVEAMGRLVASEPPPERIVVETSGVSRPIAVADALDDPALAGRVALDAVLCLVDAAAFPALDYAATELAIEQTSAADLVLLNKCDIASADDRAAVETTLAGAFPDMRLVPTAFADVPRALLFGPRERAAARRAPAHGHGHHQHDHGPLHGHDHDHDHDHGAEFAAWSWRSARPLDRDAFRAAVRRLPDGLLRAKGVLRFADAPDGAAVFQLVGRRSTLETARGAAPAESTLVAIGRAGGFDAAALTRLLDGCVSV